MKYKTCALALVAATSLFSSAPAFAVDVTSGSITLGPKSLTQIGRLVRGGVQQDWTGVETFPGVNNTSTRFSYVANNINFAANAFQDVYYDISFDDESSDLFASTYLNSYDPNEKSKNWIGDAGSSQNYFPGDARYFDVVVPKGNSLTFVVNSTLGTGVSTTANYFIQAFSDTEYNENFMTAAVPEPATWAMMLIGFGSIGFAMRRRQSIKTTVRFAQTQPLTQKSRW